MSRHLAVTILLRRLTAPVRWCDLKEEFQLQSNLLSGAYVQIIRWVLVFSKPSVPVCCKILDATCCPVSVVWSAEGGAGARGRDWYAWYFLTITAQARSSLSVSLSLSANVGGQEWPVWVGDTRVMGTVWENVSNNSLLCREVGWRSLGPLRSFHHSWLSRQHLEQFAAAIHNAGYPLNHVIAAIDGNYLHVSHFNFLFLAPSGAQGVTLSVCPSVCLSGTNLSKGLNLHLRAVWVSPRSV